MGELHYRYTLPEADSIKVSINLRPGAYIFSGKPALDQYLADSSNIKIRELLLEHFTGGRQKSGKLETSEQARIIRTRDLQNTANLSHFSGPLTDNKLYPFRKDRILEDGDVLVPLHDPTGAKVFQLGQDHASCGANPNLLVLRVDQAQIIPAYLVQQLKHPMVALQIKRAYTGSAVPRVSGKALLDIVIPIQPLAGQRLEVERIERNYGAHYPAPDHVDMVEEPLPPYLKSTTPPYIKALKHYISNRYQGVQRYTNLLVDYLEEHEDISKHWLDEKEKISLGRAITKLTHFQQDLQEITHNIEELFRLDKPPHLVNGDLRKVLKDVAYIYQEDFEVVVNGQGAIMPYNDFGIKVMVENLLSNFAKHGGLRDLAEPKVEFTVQRPTKDTVEITYRNNGKPFPDALSFEDYLAADHRAGDHGGAGLGGSLIQKAVEKMNGTIQPLSIHGLHPSGWNVSLLITLKRI
jgi:signal transduction histidine kinase